MRVYNLKLPNPYVIPNRIINRTTPTIPLSAINKAFLLSLGFKIR